MERTLDQVSPEQVEELVNLAERLRELWQFPIQVLIGSCFGRT